MQAKAKSKVRKYEGSHLHQTAVLVSHQSTKMSVEGYLRVGATPAAKLSAGCLIPGSDVD